MAERRFALRTFGPLFNADCIWVDMAPAARICLPELEPN